MQQEVRAASDRYKQEKKKKKKKPRNWKLLFAATGDAAGASVQSKLGSSKRPLQIKAEPPGG